jgi:predicted transcriptional regulator
MAKKTKQSLAQRIKSLINRVGAEPQPTLGLIKSELMGCLGLAQTLENSEVISELEDEVTVLETALKKSNLENSNLQTELQSLKTEVDTFRAERRKQEDENRRQDIDDIQFQILEQLGSPTTCDWLKLGEIARAVNIPVDEAEVYMDGLNDLGLVFYHPHEPGGGGWLRTAKGNKLVVAKRWAGEGEPKKT